MQSILEFNRIISWTWNLFINKVFALYICTLAPLATFWRVSYLFQANFWANFVSPMSHTGAIT